MQKYDQQERNETQRRFNSGRHQTDYIEKYGAETKQLYLDDFDTAIA